MKVDVTHGLERGGSVVLEKIETVRLEPAANSAGDPSSQPDRRHQILIGDFEERFDVRARNDESVPVVDRMDIQDGERPLVFGHDDRRHVAIADPAEDASHGIPSGWRRDGP